MPHYSWEPNKRPNFPVALHLESCMSLPLSPAAAPPLPQDGAAIYLGEVVNSQGERWELQLKGAGPTPFSRGEGPTGSERGRMRDRQHTQTLRIQCLPTTVCTQFVDEWHLHGPPTPRSAQPSWPLFSSLHPHHSSRLVPPQPLMAARCCAPA